MGGGAHPLGAGHRGLREGARAGGAFVGAADPAEVVFTRNASEAINLVAQTWGEANIGPGDEIVLSVAEHHSNIVPWQMLAARKGAVLRFVELTPSEELDLQHLWISLGLAPSSSLWLTSLTPSVRC